ncbi:hypothetical protein NMY22_g8298 [Coprinellus aureogranulatus]|nr:hypothetical protein NMY22_g8298 [Coprinellus aureogranulatus]
MPIAATSTLHGQHTLEARIGATSTGSAHTLLLVSHPSPPNIPFNRNLIQLHPFRAEYYLKPKPTSSMPSFSTSSQIESPPHQPVRWALVVYACWSMRALSISNLGSLVTKFASTRAPLRATHPLPPVLLIFVPYAFRASLRSFKSSVCDPRVVCNIFDIDCDGSTIKTFFTPAPNNLPIDEVVHEVK